MKIGNVLAQLSIRRKFFAILAVQVVVLAVVAFIGFAGIQDSQDGNQQAVQRLAKAQVVTKTLNDANILRTVHVSLIAAARDETYTSKRMSRFKEITKDLEDGLAKMEATVWAPEEAGFAEKAITATRKYNAGFQAAFDAAKADREGTRLGELMEANIGVQRDARAAFNSLQVTQVQEAQKALIVSQKKAAQREVGILVAAGVAVLAGIFLVTWVGRQMQGAGREIKAAMAALASGDLTRMAIVEGDDEFAHIAGDLNQVVQALREDINALALISERTASGATELHATAEELSGATTEISDGAERQRVAVEQSTTSLSQLSRALGEIHQGASRTAQLSENSLRISKDGADNVLASTQAMQAILESSEKVGRITTVISDIARQTNLLSLNAAIEAAKAGAQGKGFAVVAEEIRKLAERSATAAKEISGLILESGTRVEKGSQSVNEVRNSLEAIEADLRSQAEIARQSAEALQEQARVSEDVTASMVTTMSYTERNASATIQLASSIRETSRTIDELAQLAQDLQSRTRRFRL